MEKYSEDNKQTVMSRDEVRAFDSWAINTLGVFGVVLMENAGRSCAELIKEKLSDQSNHSVCVFCGKGNNGGDGYVVARHLLNNKIKVKVIICGDPAKVKGDAKINMDILTGVNQPIETLDMSADDLAERVAKYASDSDIIVDAIFGTGLQGELKENYKVLIEVINAQQKHVVAVDIPSGLDCDSGEPLPVAVKAKQTVTFAAVKKGFAENSQSAQYTGEVYVASIGVEPYMAS
jgi:NAD(P)H-hydrate epimerase